MAQTVCVIVSTADRDRLQAIVGERNQPRKDMDRARIILACAEREPTHRVAARVGLRANTKTGSPSRLIRRRRLRLAVGPSLRVDRSSQVAN